MGMATMSPPELRHAGESRRSSHRIAAIYARLRQAMPHLSATLRPNATFADCGGDSLDLVELCCLVDSDYGIRLSVDDLASVRTVDDILTLIDERSVRRPAVI
jgi:acyl carrier protein